VFALAIDTDGTAALIALWVTPGARDADVTDTEGTLALIAPNVVPGTTAPLANVAAGAATLAVPNVALGASEDAANAATGAETLAVPIVAPGTRAALANVAVGAATLIVPKVVPGTTAAGATFATGTAALFAIGVARFLFDLTLKVCPPDVPMSCPKKNDQMIVEPSGTVAGEPVVIVVEYVPVLDRLVSRPEALAMAVVDPPSRAQISTASQYTLRLARDTLTRQIQFPASQVTVAPGLPYSGPLLSH
jgi:hypothetical protein